MLPSNDDWSFVCVLSSVNLLHYDKWTDTDAVETLTFITRVKSDWQKIKDTILSDSELVFYMNRIKFDVVDNILRELWPS